MIVLGADTHKRSHTIAAVSARTGELLGEQTVLAGAEGAAVLLRWARGLGVERVWGWRIATRFGLVGADFDRARRAGSACRKQVDGGVAAGSSWAWQVRQHRRARGRASGAARGPGHVAGGALRRARARLAVAGRSPRAAGLRGVSDFLCEAGAVTN